MDRINRMKDFGFYHKTILFFYPVNPVHPVKKDYCVFLIPFWFRLSRLMMNDSTRNRGIPKDCPLFMANMERAVITSLIVNVGIKCLTTGFSEPG
jgi:hypothetical protein